MGVKHTLRRAAAHTIGGLWLDKTLAWLTGGRAAILAYHRVLDPAEHDLDAVEPGMFVTRETFRAHLDFLRRRYRIVPLTEVVRQLLTGEKPQRGAVALTFDDAWLDTYQVAYPLLRAAGLPATVFVPTGLVDAGHRFWFSRAAGAIKEIYRRREMLRAAFPDEKMPAEAHFVMDVLAENPSRTSYFQRIMAGCKDLTDEARGTTLAFLEILAEKADEPRSDLADWEQLRLMNRDVFEIGSHTVGHRLLTQLDGESVKRELMESRDTIAARFGKPPASFCYPNGNYTPSITRHVARAGYACAVTTAAGFADPPADLFALPRLGVHQGVAPDAAGLALLLSGIG